MGRWGLTGRNYQVTDRFLPVNPRSDFMIKGIIFDLDQTLIHFTGDWSEVVRQGAQAMSEWYLKKRRVKLDQAACIEAFVSERKAGRVLAMQTQQEVVAQDSLREALKKIDAPARALPMVPDAIKIYFEAESAAWQRYPETIDMLKQLQADGYKLGLYTNATDDDLVQRLVNRFKLRPWLSPTFSSAGWGWCKPKPEPFLMIADRWQLPPEQIVVVGDTLNTDILGAQNAGMRSILVTMNEAPSNEDYRHIQPTATISSLATLATVIDQLDHDDSSP